MFQEPNGYLIVLLVLITCNKRFIPSFQGDVGHAAARDYVRLLATTHIRCYQIRTWQMEKSFLKL